MGRVNFHNLPIEKVFAEVSSAAEGLSSQEAKRRLAGGANELPQEQETPLGRVLLKQFNNPIIYILAGAALISFLNHHLVDGFFIGIVVLISVGVGFLEEAKADRAVKKLRKLVDYKVTVWRDRKKASIPSFEVVKGDVVVLKEGDRVPADGRVIKSNGLEVSESVLTGESLPQPKTVAPVLAGASLAERANMVYAGTIVTSGEGEFVVTATGPHTELGRIASLVLEAEDRDSPLQRKIKKFSLHLSIILVAVNLFVFLLGVGMGRDLYQMFLTAVAMVVAAVPEGLLPSLVIVLAVGMQKILQRKGLVKQMMAAETLGSVSVICTDKTGTLTKGEMRLSKILPTQDIEKPCSFTVKKKALCNFLILKIGLLCNNSFLEKDEKTTTDFVVHGSPTERALFLAAYEAGLKWEDFSKEKKVGEIPFNSDNKFMAVLFKSKKKYLLYFKGAPEKALSFSRYFLAENNKVQQITDSFLKEAKERYHSLTREGMRVLGLAYKEIDFASRLGKTISKRLAQKQKALEEGDIKNIVLAGFVGLADPLRDDVKEAVSLCRQAGIKTVIVTGDHRLTAQKIAREVGITAQEENMLEGEQLDDLGEEDFLKRIRRITVYARVEPRHKIRIVKAWQSLGEVVAMTGDGVNDSPALKSADIGIALGSGSDIAKETADLILLDDSFGVIVEAIKRGRIIFNNIKKVIIYLLTDSFTEVFLVGGSLLFGWALPILPAQILWVNLVEDTAPSMALAFDEVDEQVMTHKPYKNKKILSKNTVSLIVFYSLIMNLLLLAIFYFYQKFAGIAYARTVTFVGLGFSSLFYVYSIRGIRRSVFKINPFTNRFLTYSNLLGLFMFVVALYLPFLNKILKTAPLGLFDWGVLVGYGIISILVYEIGKKFFKQ